MCGNYVSLLVLSLEGYIPGEAIVKQEYVYGTLNTPLIDK